MDIVAIVGGLYRIHFVKVVPRQLLERLVVRLGVQDLFQLLNLLVPFLVFDHRDGRLSDRTRR